MKRMELNAVVSTLQTKIVRTIIKYANRLQAKQERKILRQVSDTLSALWKTVRTEVILLEKLFMHIIQISAEW